MEKDSTEDPFEAHDARLMREQSVILREEVAQGERRTVDRRDDVTQAREQEMNVREALVLSREKIIYDADASKAAHESQALKLREANEHLVITAIHAQEMVEKIQKTHDQLHHMANYDLLTDLPNRSLLKERLIQAIALAQRRGTALSLLFLDLDNFKYINDSLGHATGDALLRAVAHRLSCCVRSSDTVSRQGGDEFVILLTEDKLDDDAAITAKKILAEISLPHFVDGHELHVTGSIGITAYPNDAEDAETLIKNADTAMYQAKEKGRNNYQFFKHDMNVRAVERQTIETHLRHALARQEFVLHYQAKVNLVSGVITGAEALLRWTHPEWGTVLPERFVSIAEECGLIVPIGRWVLREACAQAKRWDDAGLHPTSVAVNLSAVEFRHRDFLSGLRVILLETGLTPSCLQLEITESVLMQDIPSSTEILKELKQIGVKLAVDDFGTGYSSLSYLKRFPIDILKIDQSFVHDLGSTPQHGADSEGVIVSAVIALGTTLKQQVVAEGIEDEMQLAFLKARHCTEGQGFFFSRPLGAEQFAALLASGIPAATHLDLDLAPGDAGVS
jgi:diguanylate cyclase (GGDEF)-like protein